MEITLQLKEEQSAAFLKNLRDVKLDELLACVNQFGSKLKPLHPGCNDIMMSRYCYLFVEDSRVDIAMEKLSNCSAIDAIYIKPRDEIP